MNCSDPTGQLTTLAILGIVVSGIIGGVVAACSAVAAEKTGWELITNIVIGVAVGAGTAAVAAVAAIEVAAGTLALTRAAQSVAGASAMIGAAGECASQITEYGFHHTEENYEFDPIVAVTSIAYSAGMNSLSGLMSFGLNNVFVSAVDEVIGVCVSAEGSVALGSMDFGIRQIISAVSDGGATHHISHKTPIRVSYD